MTLYFLNGYVISSNVNKFDFPSIYGENTVKYIAKTNNIYMFTLSL